MLDTDYKQTILPLHEAYRQDILKDLRAAARTEAFANQPEMTVTADDVRKLVKIPKEISKNVMGAVFHEPCWESVGFRKSTRPAAKGRWIQVYRYNRLRDKNDLLAEEMGKKESAI